MLPKALECGLHTPGCLILHHCHTERENHYNSVRCERHLSYTFPLRQSGHSLAKEVPLLPAPVTITSGVFLPACSHQLRVLSFTGFTKTSFLLDQRNSSILYPCHIKCTAERCYKTRLQNMSFEFFTKKAPKLKHQLPDLKVVLSRDL